jgi:Bax protein
MKRIIANLVLTGFVCIVPGWALSQHSDKTQVEQTDESAIVDVETNFVDVKHTSHLKEVLSNSGFHLKKAVQDKVDVPRVFFNNFPKDLRAIKSLKDKKQLFIQTLLPMILHINEEIMGERTRLLQIKTDMQEGLELTSDDRLWLKDLCEKYKMKHLDMDELVKRVDIIPPSLALGQSIIESGWGMSYAAREKNSPYGMTISNKVKFYNTLHDSTWYYVRNLNSNDAYRNMRNQRAKMRANGQDIDGHKLIGELLYYSEQRALYIKKVRSAIAHNDLKNYDNLNLTPTILMVDAEQKTNT